MNYTPQTSGIVIHTPRRFDLIVAAMFLFRERAFRERLADLARLAPSESLLDVGCGTGSFAIVAAGRVGASGHVRGIDASPEMIARAEAKAGRAG
jgi:ubiquinone/menaquinone biosynthesis C-methylase UbiE